MNDFTIVAAPNGDIYTDKEAYYGNYEIRSFLLSYIISFANKI